MLDQTTFDPDAMRRKREPVFNIPGVILGVLAVLVLVHVVRQVLPQATDERLLLNLAFEPGTFTYAFAPERVVSGLRLLAMQNEAGLQRAELGQYILEQGGLRPWTVLTYGLLHADWSHIGLNGLWLLAFGTPVARRIGPVRFVALSLAASVAGAAAHYITHPVDLQPVIGASAAVSGCMGAALRFMFQPDAPRQTPDGDPAAARPVALTRLRDMLGNRRVMTFLLVWFVTNLLFGLGSVPFGLTSGAIAWEAHIGGFVFGMLAFDLFDRPGPVMLPPVEPDPAPP